MELCIGTVQMGMNYGIKNTKKPDKEYALKILDYATHNGIRAIDTATAYGDAERIVGEFVSKSDIPRNDLFISTKLLPNILDNVEKCDYVSVIRDNLEKSLRVLRTDYIDVYLLHSSRYAFDDSILDALIEVKKSGLARKVGVSVYDPKEADSCLKYDGIEFIQAPYSVFDHRMKEKGIFSVANNYNCEISTRSAFLQGLICMEENEVPEFLYKARPIMKRVDTICKEANVTKIELALSFVKREQAISHLVFGVDTIEQLKEDIRVFESSVDEKVLKQIELDFKDIDTSIVIPSLWKR